MIFTILLVVLGIYLEKRFSPRIKKEGDNINFHYTASKGARNSKTLFTI